MKRKAIDDYWTPDVGTDEEVIQELVEYMVESVVKQSIVETKCESIDGNSVDINDDNDFSDEEFWDQINFESINETKDVIESTDDLSGQQMTTTDANSDPKATNGSDFGHRYETLMSELTAVWTTCAPVKSVAVSDGTRTAVQALTALDSINDAIIGLTKRLAQRLSEVNHK